MSNIGADDVSEYDHYYLSYSGTALPLNLVSPLDPSDVQNRNTYFGMLVDDLDRVVLIHKRVYGEIELSHRYAYHEEGSLSWAEILGIEDGRRLVYDRNGSIVEEIEIDIDD